ncbi:MULTISPECIES: DnaJ domain-containing protein [unclassified Caballeronia]|uniref:J domain-containing protein n=1 Tax=unclassified Caballeronia TaxID=2646786 RepID=UPI00285CC3D3|nr:MULTISPECIES: DnaJ domain-containing protein [unclassified Caballeronia]MDR5738903.1 DnaJ domain-containing protein [Caballeronia sp. LZ016]MDR5807391.1 DnaJ domain-containing protein [Caballeronia sp. LZ019]
MATLYETLGVQEHATEDEIKRAYRKAAMRCHPDRNVGNEEAAHAKFHEIKEAYAILSDPAQREVYDRIFAEEVARREAQLREEEAAREALYAKRVSLAMRFASQGHNGDVVFGVLLGHDCDEATARHIAESVVALHASREAKTKTEPAPDTREEPAQAADQSASGMNPLGAMWFQFFNNMRL